MSGNRAPYVFLSFLIVLCSCQAETMSSSEAGRPPTLPGSFEGAAEDGSRLRLQLVESGTGIKVIELGYEFIPTGMTIQRVFLKSGQPFGETGRAGLILQFPVLLKFSFDNSLTSERGSTSLRFYEAVVTAGEGETVNVSLAATENVKKEYDGTFSMEQIKFGPAPEGSQMKKSYSLVLAKK